MADLNADLKELQELAAQCQRPRVKALLDEQVQRLQALATEKAQGAASRAPAAPSKPPAAHLIPRWMQGAGMVALAAVFAGARGVGPAARIELAVRVATIVGAAGALVAWER